MPPPQDASGPSIDVGTEAGEEGDVEMAKRSLAGACVSLLFQGRSGSVALLRHLLHSHFTAEPLQGQTLKMVPRKVHPHALVRAQPLHPPGPPRNDSGRPRSWRICSSAITKPTTMALSPHSQAGLVHLHSPAPPDPSPRAIEISAAFERVRGRSAAFRTSILQSSDVAARKDVKKFQEAVMTLFRELQQLPDDVSPTPGSDFCGAGVQFRGSLL